MDQPVFKTKCVYIVLLFLYFFNKLVYLLECTLDAHPNQIDFPLIVINVTVNEQACLSKA